MPHRVRLSWRAIGHLFEVIPNVDPVSKESLLAAEGAVRLALKRIPALAHREFALPSSLKAFYEVAQDCLKLGDRFPDRSFQFYAVQWLATDGLALSDEAQGDSTPWLEIGAYSDRHHWVFICCDPEDPLFGAVVDCENCTPWSRTVYRDEVYDDLGDFLRALTEERAVARG